MIKRMIFGLFLFCMMIAIPLSAMGIRHVELGPSTIAFLNQTSIDLSHWQLRIPNIPQIQLIPWSVTDGVGFDILKLLYNIIFGFINFITTLINVFIGMVNFVLMFTQYLMTLLKNLIAYSDTLKRIGTY